MVDAQTLANGDVIAASVSYHENDTFLVTKASSWITHFSPNGQVLGTDLAQADTRCIKATTIAKGTNGHPYQLLALTWDSLTLLNRSIGQFQVNALGAIGSSHHHLVQDGTRDFIFFDAALDHDSALFIAGGVNINNFFHTPNMLLLMRLGTDGTELGQRILDTASTLACGLHSVLLDSLMLTSVIGGSIGPWGITKYLRFNENLDYIDGFPGTSVTGNGNPLPPDSILRDSQYMSATPGGSIIITGRIGSLSQAQGLSFVATRLSSTGTQEAVFLPEQETLYDYCSRFQSHDLEPDGSVVTAVVHNFNPYSYAMSFTPSRIHIYQLDTMLNVLCDQVAVDGAEDGSYYMLNRVKATPDGGTLLMGSKMNVNTQSLPQPWIMKIAPWDCQSGIGEHEAESTATVWPNPGSTGFTAFVNGPVVARGTLELYNAQGQLATSTDVLQSSATVNATNLAPGVYLYRITDGQGALRATGRWVKE
ncbi:MAG: T9SS type A sorting domain-containing protein [Bacteroidetes bacterium]|nr:T9SS type A sorting domain-containing protein [Bacteroidota bacterium]